jgi:hypothetical protein
MQKAPLVLSLAATLTLGALGITAALAQTPATLPAAAPADTQPAAVASVLGTAAAPAASPVALSDQLFESLSGGIAIRYPAGSKALREAATDDLIEFRDEARKSSMVIRRQTYPAPMNLTAARDGHGQMQPGILEQTVAAITKQYADPELLKKKQPGVKMLRQDLTNLGNCDVGMLVFRYTRDAERHLAQTAIIEANDHVFYAVSLTTPGRQDPVIPLDQYGDETNVDPGEQQAVELFRKIIESVKLLDRAQIYEDQRSRLIRTRTLLTNWTERRLMATLIPEGQYFRILRENKDKPGTYTEVGCRYIVEEPDRKGAEDGIKVGVHTIFSEAGPAASITPKTPRSEIEDRLSVSVDRKHEDWSRQTVINDGSTPTPDHPWPKLVEFGTSDLKTSRFLLVDPKRPQTPQDQYRQGTNEDPHQPWIGVKDEFSLNVQYVGTMGNQDPVNRKLPVFYLPQALDSMLPRLVPPNEVKSYLLATYVTDAREVMLRYVEVKPVQQVTLAGRSFQAIPITDHIGVEGSVTTHYVSPTGQYLGSENKDTHIVVIPTDHETLKRLWPDTILHPPGDPGVAPQPAAPDLISRGGPRSTVRPVPAGGLRRSGISVAPGSPLDVNAPSRNGLSPVQSPGDSILPDPVLTERPARNQK